MLIDWFTSNEFKQFKARVKYLGRFVSLSKGELLIGHYEELRTHFKKIRKILLELIELYIKELNKIKTVQQSQNKERFEVLSSELRLKLETLQRLIDSGLIITEEILKIRVVGMITEHKNKLVKIIDNIAYLVEEIKEGSSEIKEMYEAQEKSATYVQPITKISLTGRVYNLWPLNNVQNVINQLGGRIIKTGGGEHPYKIVFQGTRTIPLGKHTAPDALVRELSKITGQSKRTLEASFAKGKLVYV